MEVGHGSACCGRSSLLMRLERRSRLTSLTLMGIHVFVFRVMMFGVFKVVCVTVLCVCVVWIVCVIIIAVVMIVVLKFNDY